MPMTRFSELFIFMAAISTFLLIRIRDVHAAEQILEDRVRRLSGQTTRKELIDHIAENCPDFQTKQLKHMSYKKLYRLAEDIQYNDTHLYE